MNRTWRKSAPNMDGAISPSKDTIQTTHPEVYAAGDCAVTVPSARVAAPSVILFTPNTDLKDMTIVKFKFSSVLMGLGHHPPVYRRRPAAVFVAGEEGTGSDFPLQSPGRVES